MMNHDHDHDEESATDPPRSQRTRPLLLALGAAIVLIGASCVAFYAGWKYRDGRDAAPTTQVSEVVVDRPVVALDNPSAEAGSMPNVVGLPSDQARQAIADAGIPLRIVSELGTPYAGAGGAVVEQSPPSGADAPSAIELTVSQATAVPDMAGAYADDVRDLLGDLGVRVNTINRYVAGTPEGIVLSSQPPAGEVLPTELTIEVSSPASSVFVADLRAANGDCRIGDIQIDGEPFTAAIYCEPGAEEPDVIEYLLNREVETFSATIGIADRSNTEGTVEFEVLVDEVSAYTAVLEYGRSETVSVSTIDGLRLSLRVRRTDVDARCCDVAGVWADAQLSGSAEAIDALFAESNS